MTYQVTLMKVPTHLISVFISTVNISDRERNTRNKGKGIGNTSNIHRLQTKTTPQVANNSIWVSMKQ